MVCPCVLTGELRGQKGKLWHKYNKMLKGKCNACDDTACALQTNLLLRLEQESDQQDEIVKREPNDTIVWFLLCGGRVNAAAYILHRLVNCIE